MKQLQMHKSATVDGMLFIQFIALILISTLRKEMRASGLIERYPYVKHYERWRL